MLMITRFSEIVKIMQILISNVYIPLHICISIKKKKSDNLKVLSNLPSQTPLGPLQVPEWLLPLDAALQEAPSETGLLHPLSAVLDTEATHSGDWLLLDEVAEADALLSVTVPCERLT